MIFFIFQLNSIRPAAAISRQQRQQPFLHAAVELRRGEASRVSERLFTLCFNLSLHEKSAALNIWSTESGQKKKERKKDFLRS